MEKQRRLEYAQIKEKIRVTEDVNNKINNNFDELNKYIQSLYSESMTGSRTMAIKDIEAKIDDLKIMVTSKLTEVRDFFEKDLLGDVQTSDEEQAEIIQKSADEIETNSRL